MSRQAVGRLEGRMYKHHVKSTGRLPTDKERRTIERKARETAERVERSERK